MVFPSTTNIHSVQRLCIPWQRVVRLSPQTHWRASFRNRRVDPRGPLKRDCEEVLFYRPRGSIRALLKDGLWPRVRQKASMIFFAPRKKCRTVDSSERAGHAALGFVSAAYSATTLGSSS